MKDSENHTRAECNSLFFGVSSLSPVEEGELEYINEKRKYFGYTKCVLVLVFLVFCFICFCLYVNL